MKRSTATSALAVSADQALAYRVAAHELAERLAGSRVADAARGGMRDRPPDGASPAFHARLSDFSLGDYDKARSDGTLVTVYAMRGAAYVVPGTDVAAFTAGCLPADSTSLRDALAASAGYLDSAGISPEDALGAVTTAIAAVLADAGGATTKGAISTALHGLLPPMLEPMCAGCNARHAPEPLFRLGLVAAGSRLVPDAPGGSTFIAAEPPPSDPQARSKARLELARRFVHYYAPVAPEHLAAWAGIGIADARARFAALGDELAPVDLAGRRAWARTVDLDALDEPAQATGVRLLPRDDPFVAQRDRATLAPDKDLQRKLWCSTGSSATLLVNGRLAGICRAKKQGPRIVVSIQQLRRLPMRVRSAIEVEAEGYGASRGAPETLVEFIDE